MSGPTLVAQVPLPRVSAVPTKPTTPDKAPPVNPDEQALKAARLSPTGPELLDFFRKRATPDPGLNRVNELIRRLADKAATKSDSAFGELVSLGASAIAELRLASNNLDDLDAAGRAKQCLQLIEGPSAVALTKTAARRLGQQRPAGTAEVLLAYLPFADDDGVVQEISTALTAVALKDGKLDPALLKALEDPTPIRRGVAAEVVCKSGGSAERSRVLPLLKDPKPTVRLRAAHGLARNHDAEAIPVLIELLAELPATQRKLAEDYLAQLAGEWAVTVPPGDDPVLRTVRRDLWVAWWKAVDGASLLEGFRKRTLSDADRDEILGLIEKLDNADLEIREKAAVALVARGAAAAPLLHQAAATGKPSVRLHAARCLQLIGKEVAGQVPTVAVRLVSLRKPPGTAEVLLGFTPFAENESVARELQAALSAVAVKDGKPDPVLIKGLKDAVGLRRSAAAEALCRAGLKPIPDEVLPLLQDREAVVRSRVALALVEVKDKRAIPTLIALLGDLPADQCWQIEEVLGQIASGKGPAGPPGTDAAARQKHREAWALWWQQNGATLDLNKIDSSQGMMGHTLILAQFDGPRRTNRVLEVDLAGKVLWQIEGLNFAVDAQYAGGDRVLIIERGGRVTERDTKGAVIWEKQVGNAQTCERLQNGNTLIVAQQQIVEVDREGKDVVTYTRPASDIAAAHRLPDGQVAILTYQANYVVLDKSSKETKTVNVPFVQNWAASTQFLPNDRLLVSMASNNKVAEYDLEGKEIWSATVPSPNSAVRLTNGHTLVVSMGQQIVEINRAGQTVWEYKDNVRPLKARRR
jgi:HEAT repeat protein